MPTTYRGALGFLALLSLTVSWLVCPLPAAAQPAETVVAVDPPEVVVEPQATFSVAVTIADAPELRSYQVTLTFDPAVVAVEAVEPALFLEGQTLSDIDSEAGTATFGVLNTGSGPWPSGAGELATLTLRAVGEGVTELELRDLEFFDADLAAMEIAVEAGRVQVGDETVPTDTPTEEVPATATPTASGEEATATSPPEATATKTPTGGATAPSEPTAVGTAATRTATGMPPSGATETAEPTAAATPTEGTTEPPTEAATEAPTAEGTPAGGATSTAQPGRTPTAEGPPSATAGPAEGEDVEPTGTQGDGPTEEETSAGFSPWLVVAAAVLGLAGIALIGWGVLSFVPGRRRDEESMDDDGS